MASLGDRVALLIVRAWLEPDSQPPALRARITIKDDLAEPGVPARTSAAGDIETVCDAIRSWLEAFIAGGRCTGQPPK